jgi:hypothetical protein
MAKALSKVNAKHDLKRMIRNELAGYTGKNSRRAGLLFLALQKMRHVIEGIDDKGNPIEGLTIDQQIKASDTVMAKMLPYIIEKEGDNGAKNNPLAGLLGQGGSVTISFNSFQAERNSPEKTSIEILPGS